MDKFFINSIRRAGKVIGYGVYDEVNGLRSQHAEYMVMRDGSTERCLELAQIQRDKLNEGKN